MCLVMLQGMFRLDMKTIRMEKHKNRLPGEVESLYHRKNDESRVHSAMRQRKLPAL